jgi:mannose-6-phosphate isomerase-like protein (cupin superfamily)
MKLLLLFLALPLVAADPPGFSSWTGAEMKSHANAVKLDDHKVGVDKLATYDNHAVWVIRRGGDGEAEVHDSQVDVIFVISGEGTLVIGGKMVDPHTTAPGESRAKSISGGVNKKMAPGDVFHIPAKLPHQMLVPKELVFNVVKVDSK